MSKKVIVVLYEYFYPGYKAGGPIQSLVNMVQALQHQYEFKVITTAYDLNNPTTYNEVALDKWNNILLPGSNLPVTVWYDSQIKPSLFKLKYLIKNSKPDAVFINGFYTSHFLYPVLLKKVGFLKNMGIVVSPRGMLQAGALAIKPTQKKIYLNALKALGLCKKVTFHATTSDEEIDIKTIFGKDAKVAVAGNIPKIPLANIGTTTKQQGSFKLVYLSVITPKKNLLLLIQQIKQCKQIVVLHIYGPVKEDGYWQKCSHELINLPSNISIEYKGHIPANLVQATLSNYDAFVLPTQGENFGHALYESLSVGTPIITSFFTPWNNLQQKNAGWNIDINDSQAISTLIDTLSLKDENQWHQIKKGALQLASNYYYGQSFMDDYEKLFNKSIVTSNE